MTHPRLEAPCPAACTWTAIVAALMVGLLGIYPHVRWSLELGQLAWFHNSYDEGYYSWLSINGFASNRCLSDLVMHALYVLSGLTAQRTMILADFFLPAGATLACCYLVRPLFKSAVGMVAGAALVMVSAECLALRSSLIPHAGLRAWLQHAVVPVTGGPSGILQLENPTATFWLFRTPEPQASWIVMFFALGVALRLVLRPTVSSVPWGWVALASILAGIGYLFCALSVGGAFVLFSVLAARSHSKPAAVLGTGGGLCLGVCLCLSILATRQSGGESLVFPSHRPVITIGVLLGLLSTGLVLWQGISQKHFSPTRLFAIALGLTPLCMANQQLVTGHMIYLLNFENFAFAQFGTLAALIAISPGLRASPEAPNSPPAHSFWWRILFPGTVILVLGGITGRSQILGFHQYMDENRLARSYAIALQSIPAAGQTVVCDDFYVTDILPVLLGRHPDFLVSRDMIFSDPIPRLKNPRDFPTNRANAKTALFRYLALTGASAENFSRRFDAITDPANPNWQDRFLLGGFLYNHADFWTPLTHGRDTRLEWIEAQKPAMVEAYAQFLLKGPVTAVPVVFIMRQDRPTPSALANLHAQPLAVPPAPVALKAYRIEASLAQ